MIASAIRELRLRLGETQMQFAIRTRLALSTVARYETGAQRPKLGILKIFCALADQFPDLVSVFNREIERRVQDGSQTQMLRRQGAPIRSAAFHGQLQRLLIALDKHQSTADELRDAITHIDNALSLAEVCCDK